MYVDYKYRARYKGKVAITPIFIVYTHSYTQSVFYRSILTKNKQQRRKRNHRHLHYNKKKSQLDSNIDTYVNLIDSINQPQGVHKIKTTLFPISLPELRELQ